MDHCAACARHEAERRLNRMFLGTLLVVGAMCVTALAVSGAWRAVVAWLAWPR